MDLLRQHIKPGQVYRRSDLEYYSTAIDRHLAQLTRDGILVKIRQGLYHAPRRSKFGTVPPDDLLLVARFLKDEDFLLITPNAYNTLGLGLTQLYNTTWVYNHKRSGEVSLNGRSFLFKYKSAFPKTITREYLLVDLLNNLDVLAEDPSGILEKMEKRICDLNTSELAKMSQNYGIGQTKRILKSLIRDRGRRHA
jgi:hypothetical protein